MAARVVTVVDARVDPARDAELIAGYQSMNEGARLDGLLRSELLRGQDGIWRIQSTWRDMDALAALRSSGVRPAALDLFESVEAQHSHGWFTVEQAYETP
ncbi:MAG: antibiotic biosynthesis monooxygenase [Actinomycetes bacterium]